MKLKEEEKSAHTDHYADAVLSLSKLYVMTTASEEARELHDEVSFA